MLLKPLQDADVRESQRAAAFQRHADFGPRLRRGFVSARTRLLGACGEAGFGWFACCARSKEAPEAALEWIEHGAS